MSVECYSACGLAWATCHTAAELVAGTIAPGTNVPAALACNAVESRCMAACYAASPLFVPMWAAAAAAALYIKAKL